MDAGTHWRRLGGTRRTRGHVDTSRATYVWLPMRFDDGAVRMDWLDEWRIDAFA